MNKLTLTLGWLYPELMSTYGDRGNTIILSKRLKWRDIEVKIMPIDAKTTSKDIQICNLIIGGGAQDRQQTLVIGDLRDKKGPVLKELFSSGTPGLFVCGSPQLLGHSYMTAEGIELKGLGIFDMESKHFGKEKPRCIGNTICEISEDFKVEGLEFKNTVIGFENHGGRTYLGEGVKPFAKVIKGYGNNGEDGTEGAIYKHCIATYSHGPFLSKNPHIADWLLSKALHRAYGEVIPLKPLDDTFAWNAHDQMKNSLI